MHEFRELAEQGGLLSHSPSFPGLFRRAADHVDKILRGANSDNIPVEQPIKFEFVINPNTAKALGISISFTPLARATRCSNEAAGCATRIVQLANIAPQAKDVLGVDKLESIVDRGYFSGDACDRAGIEVTLSEADGIRDRSKGPFR